LGVSTEDALWRVGGCSSCNAEGGGLDAVESDECGRGGAAVDGGRVLNGRSDEDFVDGDCGVAGCAPGDSACGVQRRRFWQCASASSWYGRTTSPGIWDVGCNRGCGSRVGCAVDQLVGDDCCW